MDNHILVLLWTNILSLSNNCLKSYSKPTNKIKSSFEFFKRYFVKLIDKVYRMIFLHDFTFSNIKLHSI